MILGIEIGGTKLQLGVAGTDGSDFVAMERVSIEEADGAEGILRKIEQVGRTLISQHAVSSIGIGFGGPINADRRTVTTSHQIYGWDQFPLVDWSLKTFSIPTVLGNDCDVAALAESRWGAGRGRQSVFYVTVGTGIGGGMVLEGQLYGGNRPAIAEIGHLRPGLDAIKDSDSVESIASGRGIEQFACQLMRTEQGDSTTDLLARCSGDSDLLSAKMISQAAEDGNEIALRVLDRAMMTLGWAIAQAITLTAPEVVILGGGVSLMAESLFFDPLRRYVADYVFPPLAHSYEISAAALGELAVVHGAVALAGME